MIHNLLRCVRRYGKSLWGPHSESELARIVGPLFIVSKRFGLEQPDKVRQTDNLSESLANSGFGASYKLDLAGVDDISVLARTFAEASGADGSVRLTRVNGATMEGIVHPSLSGLSRDIGGRTLDLGSVSKPCPPLVLCGWALFCVQALSSSCPLWLGSVSRHCPPFHTVLW